MITQEIGRIIGTVQSSNFEMILDPNILREHPPEIGEYVVIHYGQTLPKQPVLGMITSLAIYNENYLQNLVRRPDSLERLSLLGDLSEGEILIAKVQVLGYKEGSNIITPRFPPVPGSIVTRAPDSLLKEIFQVGEAEIGVLRAHPTVPVSLTLNMLVSRHFAILAITGGGKSNSIAVLVSEIIRKCQGALLIVDPHNDYLPLARNPELRNQTLIFSPNPQDNMHRLCFKYSSFSALEFSDILKIPESATRQRGLLFRGIEELEDTDWDLDDLETQLREIAEMDREIGQGLPGLLNRLILFPERTFLSRTNETPIFDSNSPSIVKSNQLSILALGGLSNRTQQAVVSQLLRKIFQGAVLYRSGVEEGEIIPIPVLIILEEAHTFCGMKNNPSLAIVSRIASEGRKFGVGLGIISQRPGKVNSDVLSQCNTQIIMRIVNPVDQNQIIQSAEALSEDLLSDLPALNIGEAVVIGPSLPIPALVKINEFRGELGGADIDILEEWQEAVKSSSPSATQNYHREGVDYNDIDY